MRISTSMLFKTTSDKLSQLQSDLLKTQQQLSSNTRILSPSDDPVAAARALEVTQMQSINTQYADNRIQAKNALNLEEQALSQLTTLIQDAQTKTIEAGNAAYNDADRASIATELTNYLEEILSVSNTRDASGNYLFSGFKTSTEAFSLTSTSATYQGDQGERSIQVGTNRQIKVSDSGDTVFQNSRGAGTFSVSAASGSFNVGTVTGMEVMDEASLTGHTYDVVFDDSSGSMTYYVYDATTDPTHSGAALASGAYTDSTMIAFDGIEFDVSGSRSNGDELTVTTEQAGANQSLFSTVQDLISLLETDTSSAAGKANLTQGLAVATENIASALDNVLTVRASVGASLKEIDTLDSAGDDRDIQYTQMLSDLQDLDYTKAISDLAQQQLTLEAAQQSYVQIVSLSLFNYLS